MAGLDDGRLRELFAPLPWWPDRNPRVMPHDRPSGALDRASFFLKLLARARAGTPGALYTATRGSDCLLLIADPAAVPNDRLASGIDAREFAERCAPPSRLFARLLSGDGTLGPNIDVSSAFSRRLLLQLLARMTPASPQLEDAISLLESDGDDRISLSDTGSLSWRGKTIAGLKPGGDVLRPRFALLGAAHLSPNVRQAVVLRVRLWAEAQLATPIQPLLALESALRGRHGKTIARRLRGQLGAVEYASAMSGIRKLPRAGRRRLGALGVHIGRYHVYMPAMFLADRRLIIARLWGAGLHQSDPATIAFMRGLITAKEHSVAPAAGVEARLYEVCGYRHFGHLAVRITALESLGNSIHAALDWNAESGVARPRHADHEGKGFLLSPELASLVGTAPDALRPILRKLGYRPAQPPEESRAGPCRTEIWGLGEGQSATGRLLRRSMRQKKDHAVRRDSQAHAWAPRRRQRLETVLQRLERLTLGSPDTWHDYFAGLDLVTRLPGLIDFMSAAARAALPTKPPVPFDTPDGLPALIPAEPKRRSVLFMHHSYYHFNFLAEALRRRGWDSLTVSLVAPDAPVRQFLHGEDINLHHEDRVEMARRTRDFFRTVPERFGALHFYGQKFPTLFPNNVDGGPGSTQLPWDFLELRRHGIIIGYMPSGCLDGARQSAIREISGTCPRCVWEVRPDVCSDVRNADWGRKITAIADWIGLEGDWATEERTGGKFVTGPVVTALGPDYWRPDLEPPEEMKIDRRPGELILYHAVGNYATRQVGTRDIKGTAAAMAAIERLKSEGEPVKLVFATNVPNTQVRFLQVQADIIIDQLNYGRYGANAREGLMLGKPVICRLDAKQAAPLPPLRAIVEAPIVSADETQVYQALRRLIHNPDERKRIGAASRAFALRWHAADACAERFETVIERIRRGLAPDSPELYPPPLPPEYTGTAIRHDI